MTPSKSMNRIARALRARAVHSRPFEIGVGIDAFSLCSLERNSTPARRPLGLSIQSERQPGLPSISNELRDLQAQRGQHGLGHRLYLFGDVVLPVQRMLHVVDWLRTGRRHHIADRAARAL